MTITRDLIHVDWVTLKSKRLHDYIPNNYDEMFGHYKVIPYDYVLEAALDDEADETKNETETPVAPEWLIEAMMEEGFAREEVASYNEKIFFYIDW